MRIKMKVTMSHVGLTITMALRWLIKSRGHSFIWSSPMCEFHTCGHTGSHSLPQNIPFIMSGGLLLWWKTLCYGLLRIFVFFFYIYLCACISCPHLHIAFCKHGNKKNQINENTFKERVKFPILECRDLRNQAFEGYSWVSLSLPWYFWLSQSTVGLFGTRKTYENLFHAISCCSWW